MRKIVVLILSVLALTGCDLLSSLFSPNFLIGTWEGEDQNGRCIYVFNDDGSYSFSYYLDDDSVKTVNGNYTLTETKVEFKWFDRETISSETRIAECDFYETKVDLVFSDGTYLRLKRLE